MPLNSTFDEIIEASLDEARLSTNQSRGVDHRNYVKRLIRRYYNFFWADTDWPFAQIRREDAGKDIQAGSRYYDFPAELDTIRAFNVFYKLGAAWTLLQYGIGTEQYSAFDSDAGEVTDPPLRWCIRDRQQFEIWPIPASDLAGGLRFEGYRVKSPLTTGSSRCDIDDDLISLHVAAEILEGNKSADAATKRAAAQAHYVMLRAQGPRPHVIMGGAPSSAQNYRIIGGRFAHAEP